jgi:multicomponent Na+:H+ antiporter subunit C
MELMWAIVIGVLYAAGLYLMMRRSIVKIILGLVMLGHAANLLIFTVGRLTRGAVPLIATGEQTLPPSAASINSNSHRDWVWCPGFCHGAF